MQLDAPAPPHVPPGHDVPLYGLDIETDTSVDGLDPTVAPVVAVAVATADGDHVLLGDERSILARTDELLASLPSGVVVTWNGARFDLPFLAHRAAVVGVDLGLELWQEPSMATEPDAFRGRWHHHVHLDGYRLYRADVGRSLGLPCGLKALARFVGLAPVEVERERLHLLHQDQVRDYVASDARTARQLVMRRWPVAALAVDGCHVPRPD
jgi:hypothetical protein